MTSYHFAPDRRKRTVARFITHVRRELQKAFLEEKAKRGVTQAQLARTLGTDRAVVCRQLSGSANLTLRTLADYAWALERDLVFAMPAHVFGVGTNVQQDAIAAIAPGVIPNGMIATSLQTSIRSPVNLAGAAVS
jgi:hypothetical protein